MRGHRSRIRRAVLGCLLMPAMLAIAPQLSAAAGWSTVNLPEHSGLNAVFCRSSRWCEAVGTNHQAQAEHWNGSRWSIEHAVKPAAPRGYRSAHTYLNAIACRGARFCLAVGSLVPVGTGNSPGRRSSSAGTARAGSCSQRRRPPDRWTRSPALRRARAPPPAAGRRPWAQTAHRCMTRSPSAGTASAGRRRISPRPRAPPGTVCWASAATELAANWDGSAWTQTVLRRGPVGPKSVSCPAAGWCMAVGPVAERYSG
jgi:hypothetical protein